MSLIRLTLGVIVFVTVIDYSMNDCRLIDAAFELATRYGISLSDALSRLAADLAPH